MPIRERKDEAGNVVGHTIESVCYIRCIAHRAVPQINSNENGYGECGMCAVLGERQRIQDAVRALPVIVDGRFQRFKTLDELTTDILLIVGN